MSCPVEITLDDSTPGIQYAPNDVTVWMHENWMRLGGTNDTVSDWLSHGSSSYLMGVGASSIFFSAILVLWSLLLLVSAWKGPEMMGLWSGRIPSRAGSAKKQQQQQQTNGEIQQQDSITSLDTAPHQNTSKPRRAARTLATGGIDQISLGAISLDDELLDSSESDEDNEVQVLYSLPKKKRNNNGATGPPSYLSGAAAMALPNYYTMMRSSFSSSIAGSDAPGDRSDMASESDCSFLYSEFDEDESRRQPSATTAQEGDGVENKEPPAASKARSFTRAILTRTTKKTNNTKPKKGGGGLKLPIHMPQDSLLGSNNTSGSEAAAAATAATAAGYRNTLAPPPPQTPVPQSLPAPAAKKASSSTPASSLTSVSGKYAEYRKYLQEAASTRPALEPSPGALQDRAHHLDDPNDSDDVVDLLRDDSADAAEDADAEIDWLLSSCLMDDDEDIDLLAATTDSSAIATRTTFVLNPEDTSTHQREGEEETAGGDSTDSSILSTSVGLPPSDIDTDDDSLLLPPIPAAATGAPSMLGSGGLADTSECDSVSSFLPSSYHSRTSSKNNSSRSNRSSSNNNDGMNTNILVNTSLLETSFPAAAEDGFLFRDDSHDSSGSPPIGLTQQQQHALLLPSEGEASTAAASLGSTMMATTTPAPPQSQDPPSSQKLETDLPRSRFTSQAASRKRLLENYAKAFKDGSSVAAATTTPPNKNDTTNNHTDISKNPMGSYLDESSMLLMMSGMGEDVLGDPVNNHDSVRLDPSHPTPCAYPKNKQLLLERAEYLRSRSAAAQGVNNNILGDPLALSPEKMAKIHPPPEEDSSQASNTPRTATISKHGSAAGDRSGGDADSDDEESRASLLRMARPAATRKLQNQLMRWRLGCVFCCTIVIVAVLLFAMNGIWNLDIQSKSIQRVWKHSVQPAVELTTSSLQQLGTLQQAAQRQSRNLYDLLDEACPAKYSDGVCPWNGTARVCDTSELPLNNLWNVWLERGTPADVQELIAWEPAIDDSPATWTTDLALLKKQPIASRLRDWHGLLWVTVTINGLLACMVFAILYGISMPCTKVHWLSSKMFRGVFLLLVMCCWIFAVADLMGLIITADICVENPGAPTEAFLGRLPTQSKLIPRYWKYHVDGCPPDEFPEGLQDQIYSWANVLPSTGRLSTALDRMEDEEYLDECGVALADLRAAASNLNLQLCLVTQSMVNVRRSLSCDQWFPIYERMAHENVCDEGTKGLVWATATQWAVVLFAMGVWTLRAAFYSERPPEEKNEEPSSSSITCCSRTRRAAITADDDVEMEVVGSELI